VLDLWTYGVRPVDPMTGEGMDCAPAIRRALADAAGEEVQLGETCDPGEYACASTADGLPAVGLPSGTWLTGAPGRVLVDAPGPRVTGVIGVDLSRGAPSRTGIVLRGLEVRHRGVSGPGEHRSSIWLYADPAGQGTVEVTVEDCQSLGSPDDGLFLGSRVSFRVRRWRARQRGRYGLCVTGYASGRSGELLLEDIRDDALLGESTQAAHVEVDGTAHLVGLVVRDVDVYGSMSLNRTAGAVLERVTLRGGDGPAGRSGGALLVTNSLDARIRGLSVDHTLGVGSDEHPLQFFGDCSGCLVEGARVVQRPGGIGAAVYVEGRGTAGLELRSTQVWHPASTRALSAPAGSVAVADIDDRLIA
jgi:hypothetical protein